MCVYFNRIFKNRIIALIVILCELLSLTGVLYCLLFCVCVCVCVCVLVLRDTIDTTIVSIPYLVLQRKAWVSPVSGIFN